MGDLVTATERAFEQWWQLNRSDSFSKNNDIHIMIKSAFMAGTKFRPPASKSKLFCDERKRLNNQYRSEGP